MDAAALNQHSLEAALRRLVACVSGPDAACAAGEAVAPGVPALDALRDAFGLTPFECDVLLLAAGCELSAELTQACARRTGGRPGVSFALCLATLPDAHWDALAPVRPLRRYRLLELADPSLPVHSPLRVPERVLHFIAGVAYVEPLIAECVPAASEPDSPGGSHQALAAVVVRMLDQTLELAPCVQLVGDDADAQLAVAAQAAHDMRLALLPLEAGRFAAWRGDADVLCRLIERECALIPALPAVCCGGAGGDALVQRIIGDLRTPLLLLAREAWRGRRASTVVPVDKPDAAQREMLWRRALGEGVAHKLNGELQLLAAQYPFGMREIAQAAARIRERMAGGEAWPSAALAVCRGVSRPRLDELAERIDPRAGWDDLVLPEAQREALRQIVAQVRARHRVYGDWGFERKMARGLGVSALFSGESGTGKTLAAEVVAAELGLDLYRIDLSGVVSKYIGETEKNLRTVFAAAEDSGAVLLFDEADALFGKRSEVKDSHDRYANIEVSYLLQRMEAYRGLAILTTNQRCALDQAFERRLRFIVHFPFPDAPQREAIWRKTFPPQTPLEDVRFERLAQLHVTGGVIRNIALNAAFLAADADRPVRMSDLAQAARAEIAKAERPTGEAQVRSWT